MTQETNSTLHRAVIYAVFGALVFAILLSTVSVITTASSDDIGDPDVGSGAEELNGGTENETTENPETGNGWDERGGPNAADRGTEGVRERSRWS